MGVPINSEAVRNAHIPISHAHIQYGRSTTYYWYISKTSHIPEFPINRKREIQYVMSFSNDAAKVQLIFHICK